MKESKDRTDQFMYSAVSAAQSQPPSNASYPSDTLRRRLPAALPPTSDSVLFNQHSRPDSRADAKGKGRALPDGELLAVDLNSVESGMSNGDGNPFQQMQLVEQQVRPSQNNYFLTPTDCFVYSRIPTYNLALLLSSPLNQPSRSLDRYSLSWLQWSPNSGKQCKESMQTLLILPTTFRELNGNF